MASIYARDRVSVENKLSPAFTRWVIQALGRLALTAAVVLGVFIVLGGDARFSGRSYTSAMTYPGAPESWGYSLALIGLGGLASSLLGDLRVTRWCLYAMAAWTLFFSISFIQSAIEDSAAGVTGIVVYLYVMLNVIALGVAHKR